jgi:hypothetical protein
MSSKIHILSELTSIGSDKNKTDMGVIHFLSAFKIPRLLAFCEYVKTKGFSISSLFLMLIMFRLRGRSIWSMQKTRANGIAVCDDNTFYRLMNNSLMNWRKLLMSFSKQFLHIVRAKGEMAKSVKCFIIDDTDIEKTGKTIEFIGKIFNHVTRRSILGFKMLTLGFWDGKSFIGIDFSLHREKGKNGNYGMRKKDLKSQFSKKREKSTPAYTRVQELDKNKNHVAISMIKRAVKNGLIASYVLMDSWFVNDHVIKSIRRIKGRIIHVLGMCKLDTRKFEVNQKEMNSRQIISRHSRKRQKYSRKHKSQYFVVLANYKGEAVKLFYLKYGRSKNWTLLLSTNLLLKFTEAIELYQIRWTIEVFFKECKQYFGLGTSQNTDFDGQIADATLALVTHTILTLHKRFSAYETMGELFREAQQHLLEMTLWERILKIFMQMLQKLGTLLNIDLNETLEQIIQDDKTACQIFIIIKGLEQYKDNCRQCSEIAA